MDIPINSLATPKITSTIPKFITIKDNIKKRKKHKYLDQILKNNKFLKDYFN